MRSSFLLKIIKTVIVGFGIDILVFLLQKFLHLDIVLIFKQELASDINVYNNTIH